MRALFSNSAGACQVGGNGKNPFTQFVETLTEPLNNSHANALPSRSRDAVVVEHTSSSTSHHARSSRSQMDYGDNDKMTTIWNNTDAHLLNSSWDDGMLRPGTAIATDSADQLDTSASISSVCKQIDCAEEQRPSIMSDVSPTPHSTHPMSQSTHPMSQSTYPTSQFTYPMSRSTFPFSPTQSFQSVVSIPQNSFAIPQNSFAIPQNSFAIPQNSFAIPLNSFGTPQHNKTFESSVGTSHQSSDDQSSLLGCSVEVVAANNSVTAIGSDNNNAEGVSEMTEASFDRTKAQALLRELHRFGGSKMLQSEFYSFVKNFADGNLKFNEENVRELVDSSNKPVHWEHFYESSVVRSEELASATRLANEPSLSFFPTNPKLDGPETLAELSSTSGPVLLENCTLFDKTDESECVSEFEETTIRRIAAAWEQYQRQGLLSEVQVEQLNGILRGSLSVESLVRHTNMETPKDGEELPSTACEERAVLRALQLLADGNVLDAVKVLEQAVQDNSQDAEAWRLLGEVHAENDQDVEAIRCLARSYEADTLNLDSLLALGSSLTNEFNSEDALRHLLSWISSHEDYIWDQNVHQPAPLDFEQLRRHVTDVFERAASSSEKVNVDLEIAFGVIENINKNFNSALLHFARALRSVNSNNASFGASQYRRHSNDITAGLWNKIGATLANSGRSKTALLAYQQALKLKPNFPRVFANVGIANSNLGEFDKAIGNYLSALRLNSGCKHLWIHIRSALNSLGRTTAAIELVDCENVEMLLTMFPPTTMQKRDYASGGEEMESVLNQIGI